MIDSLAHLRTAHKLHKCVGIQITPLESSNENLRPLVVAHIILYLRGLRILNVDWLQPQTIKINRLDQAAGDGQAPVKSSCCGS